MLYSLYNIPDNPKNTQPKPLTPPLPPGEPVWGQNTFDQRIGNVGAAGVELQALMTRPAPGRPRKAPAPCC